MENENESVETAPRMRRPKGRASFLRTLVSLIVLALFIVAIVYSVRHISPERKQAMENTALIQSIGKLMIIPNEQPIVATINQAAVLIQEQPFYTGSQNGDKLVIFPKAQKAVIYSPSRDVIVNSGPFVINQDQKAAGSVTPSQVTPQAPAEDTVNP